MSLPTYPHYKDSGVQWLTNVPAHWRVSPLKYLALLKSGGTPSKENLDYWNGDVPWASAKDLKTELLADTIDHITGFAVESRNADLVPAGTILVVVRGMILARIFPVAETVVPMAINQDLKGLIPRQDILGRFLAWLLRGSANESLLRLDEAGHGTKALRMEAWTSMQLPVPPLDEQSAIIAFLDRETGKIDALIAEQEKLLTLLGEKRQAAISHAVTNGLNPDTPVKDSGVVWLGDIPAHWSVSPLMYLTDLSRPIMYGIVLPGPNVDTGIPIVKGGDVRPHRLKLNLLNRTTPDIEAPYARARLRPSDIVYSIRGTIGDAELVPEELLDTNITQDVARISPRADIDSRWLLYAMKSKPVFVQLEQRSLGAAVRGINIFELKRAQVPLPPSNEQEAIAKFLDAEVARLNALSNDAERAISLLKEHRSALITAAVTGKIDVRERSLALAAAA